MSVTTGPLGGDQDLVVELAQLVIEQTAPEELLLFDETAREYFQDPDRVLDPRRHDEAVGFGLDLALITPVVLAVVTPVVKFLLSVATDVAKEQVGPVVRQWVRGLFRRVHVDSTDVPGPAEPALTQEQARQVRTIAHDRARQLGMAEAQADLLADAVVGGMLVAG